MQTKQKNQKNGWQKRFMRKDQESVEKCAICQMLHHVCELIQISKSWMNPCEKPVKIICEKSTPVGKS